MRATPSPPWLRRFALLVLAPAAIVACAASDAGSDAPPGTEVGTTAPAPVAEAGTQDAGAGGKDGATTTPKNDCKLPALSGVAAVTPTFESAAPPAMTGGTLDGEYRVDKATVYLPSGSAGLVNPKESTGTISAWAVFSGTSYRLEMKASFLISSVLGPQSQATDTASQGTFTASGPALTLDHACDTALANEADYSFTDTGGGRATILIKTPSSFGDTYLQLDAAKN